MDKNDMAQEYRITDIPQVFEMGSAKALSIHPDRTLSFWVFAIMTHGQMPIQIGGEHFVVHPGQYFLLPPGIRHFGTEKVPFDTIWMHFHCSTGTEGAGDIVLPAHGPLSPEINYQVWGNLLKQNLATGSMLLSDIGIQLMAILGQVASEWRRQQAFSRPGATLARRTLEFLLRHYPEQVTTHRLSAELGYSYGHIEREFRRHYTLTIRQKLAQIRIEEAVALILMGKTLREAAYETGFTDYYYFIRVFTRIRGISPGRVLSERQR
ncbi:MAG: AraC family transcriptional regulator [Armatimonas sp.]